MKRNSDIIRKEGTMKTRVTEIAYWVIFILFIVWVFPI
jgi:predicted nucleic acid-binding Zn ribbon protein